MPHIDPQTFLYKLSVGVIPLVFAITVHEVAHGWVALLRGDPTAHREGRLTLNPIKHIDPIGTIIVPLALWFFSGFAFGWAKPVPVAFERLRNPRRDMILVAAAGPGANFVMATGWALLAAAVHPGAGHWGVTTQWIIGMCQVGIFFNVLLAVFNFLPIPPLDGGRVLAGLLPPDASRVLHQIEPFGFMIVIVLLATRVLWRVIEPPILFFNDFFWSVAGLA